MLLLIGTLALLVVIISGMVAERRRLHHGHQANTIRHRRVISVFFLGRVTMADKQDRIFRNSNFLRALRDMARYVATAGA